MIALCSAELEGSWLAQCSGNLFSPCRAGSEGPWYKGHHVISWVTALLVGLVASGLNCLVALCSAGLKVPSWRVPSWPSVQATCLSYAELDQRTCGTRAPSVPTVLGTPWPYADCFRESPISQGSKGLGCLVLIWVSRILVRELLVVPPGRFDCPVLC